MASQTSVEIMALDSAGKKRLRSGSFDRPAKKLKVWSARLSSSLQSTLLAAQSSIIGSATSSRQMRTISSSQENNPSTGMRITNLNTEADATARRLAYLYRHREKIPDATKSGSCLYVFPSADECISMDHQYRFPVIKDIFKQNLQEYSQIALKHPLKTEYALKMCGTCPKNAKPTILIYHPQADKKTGMMILGLFHRPQIRQQYYNMTPSFEISLFTGPAFKHFGRAMDGLSIQLQDSCISGALLLDDYSDRISTLTCGIKFPNMGNSVFVLTTAHAFEESDNKSESDSEQEEAVSRMLLAYNDDEDQNGDIYRFGDVEYNIGELGSQDEIDEQDQFSQVDKQHDILSRYAQSQSNGLVQTTKVKAAINPSRVLGRSQKPEWDNSPNLDWALVEIDNSEQWKTDKLDLALHDIPGLGYQNRDVEVITSRGPLKGTISSIPSFIANSNNLGSLCKVWRVSLEDPSQMSVGDSGALVMDSLTEKPYGYVIGINYFQELYVIPLHSVLEQIAQMMPVCVGNPEIFMALVPRFRTSPPSEDGKESSLQFTRHLSQYWPKMGAHSTSTSFSETQVPEDVSFDSAK
ncbi:hypothetical protein V8C35DRAFT_317400 [Trichoderma chlorosporum]